MFIANRRAILGGGALAALGLSLPAQAAPRAEVERRTETFSSPAGLDLKVDLYLPKGRTQPAPVIVFVHGGAWFLGDRTTCPDLARYFAQDGFCMASIDYRPSTVSPFPANLEDVRTAVRWLRAHAAALNLDSRRIGLWGTSAGGHIAALAGLAPQSRFQGAGHSDQSSAVQCVLDGYGVTNVLTQDSESALERATLQSPPPQIRTAQAEAMPDPSKLPANGPKIMVPMTDKDSVASWMLGGPMGTMRDKALAASPLTYAAPGAPPFLIMHGLADRSVPYHQSIELYDALSSKGSEVTLRLIDQLPHTFFNLGDVDALAGPFKMAVRETARGGRSAERTETAPVYDVARHFFRKHLVA